MAKKTRCELLNEYQNIKIYEKKTVGKYIVAKVCYAAVFDHGKRLGASLPRTVIFIPQDPNKGIEISDFMEYKYIPKSKREKRFYKFGAHRFTNLRYWIDTGDSNDNCSSYDQFNTSEDIERYLEDWYYGRC